MTKKIFVSQPMRGKSPEENDEERRALIEFAHMKYGDDIEVFDTYTMEIPHTEHNALWFLGRSLQFLADAHVAVFARGWEDARGCRIERAAAEAYGIEVVDAADTVDRRALLDVADELDQCVIERLNHCGDVKRLPGYKLADRIRKAL